MSVQITTAFVQQYGATLEHLVQQRGSKLRGSVTIDSGIVGKRAFYDQIGSTAAQAPSSRHADSPLISTPHARRIIDLSDREVGDLIDKDDMVRTLVDPTNSYTQAFGMALGRSQDDFIIDAATGTALTGETGATSETHDTTNQQVAVNLSGASEGLTLAKIVRANKILRDNDAVVDGDPLTFVAGTTQLENLLNDSTITSADFNSVRLLMAGDITSFMGFNWIIMTRLSLNTSTDVRTCLAYTKSGIKLGIGRDITHRVGERSDKRFSMYAFSNMTIGATRMEQEKVVSILCDESP